MKPYGQLQVKMGRVVRSDVDEPLYDLTLENPQCVTGRPISIRLILSWEDVVALYRASRAIVKRRSDEAQEMAKPRDSTPFREVEA